MVTRKKKCFPPDNKGKKEGREVQISEHAISALLAVTDQERVLSLVPTKGNLFFRMCAADWEMMWHLH